MILLVVCQPDKVCAHLADEPHLLAPQVVIHRRRDTRMIGVPLCATQQYSFAVEPERSALDELQMTDAEALIEADVAGRTGQCDPAAIEVWRLRRPEIGSLDAKGSQLMQAAPDWNYLARGMNSAPVRIEYFGLYRVRSGAARDCI